MNQLFKVICVCFLVANLAVANEGDNVIPTYEAKPLVENQETSDNSPQISRGRYVTGGVLSTVVGLGIGHAVQGRYLPLGLVFTLGQAAGWTVYLVDRSSLKHDDNFGFSYKSTGTLGWVGLGLAGALHIWEVLDSWIVGNEYTKRKTKVIGTGISERYSPKVTVLPLSGAGSVPGASLVMTF